MRIGVVSPNRVVRELLSNLLTSELDYFVDMAESVRDLGRQDKSFPPPIVVVDGASLTIEDMHFLIGAATFGNVRPVIFGDLRVACPALPMVVPSSAPAEELIRKIRELSHPPDEVRRTPPRNCNNSFGLSAREYEVAQLVARGASNRQIAECLAITEHSARNIVSTITMKLRCEDRTQVALQLADPSGFPKPD